ncbi:type II toxin-antitoxin system VapC family toxin [Rhizobium sp. LjRoot254]|uniref:type II toxin-antitoxin system VapC family toxin n=1 Tax=Rhizobium sp. LjRoot254 TaxID=3342297 RepID=UPI003ECD0811
MRKTAVDTNILARLLAEEPGAESRYAEALLSSGRIYVSKSVLLETEWVLRAVLKIKREDVVRMLSSMLEIDRIDLECVAQVAVAIEAFRRGMDFGDALHVASASDADHFVTFDRDLVKLANRHMNEISVELAQ